MHVYTPLPYTISLNYHNSNPLLPLLHIQATDLEITAKLILHTKETLNTYLSAFCDQPMDKIRMDTDR